MNKHVVYSLVTAFLFAFPSQANATRENTCSNLYNDVDVLFIKVEGDLPYLTPSTWNDTAELIKKNNLKFAADAGLDIQTTHLTAQEVFKNHPKAMYAKLIYSSAPKTAFSIPLDGDVLSVWAEMQRSPEFDKALTTVKGRQKLSFFDPTNARPVFLSPASRGSLEGIACMILSYTKGKACTDLSDFSKNKVIDKPNNCITPSN